MKVNNDFTCRICGNNKNNKEYILKENMYGSWEPFEYFQCSKCGCLQIKNVPKNLEKYYPKQYHTQIPSFDSPVKKLKVKLFSAFLRNKYCRNSITGKFVSLIKDFQHGSLDAFMKLKMPSNTNILDVGSGNGYLLFELSLLNYKNLMGVDPFIEKDVLCGTYNVLKKEVFDIDSKKYKFDIIMLNHSFEHMKEPQAVPNKIFELLENDGICMIRIPTVSSYAWNQFKEDWIHADPPRHLYLHSVKSIRLLLNNAKMKIVDWYTDSVALQFLGSIQVSKGIYLLAENSYYTCNGNYSKTIFSSDEIKKYESEADMLNKEKRGDYLVIIAKKQTK